MVPEVNDGARRAAGNLDEVFVAEPHGFTLLQLIEAQMVVFVGDAAEKLAARLNAPRRPVEASA